MAGRTKQKNVKVGRSLYRKIKDPIRKPKPVEYDRDEADRILHESLQRSAVSTAKVTGRCLDCGKKLPGERKLCGQCFVKHEKTRMNK